MCYVFLTLLVICYQFPNFVRLITLPFEFFSHCFYEKDLRTRAYLLRRPAKNGIYEWSDAALSLPTNPVTYSVVKTNLYDWHKQLDHLSRKVLQQIIQRYNLPASSQENFVCQACFSNKSHRLPFGVSSMSSSQPSQLVFFDDWGTASIPSVDGLHYYVIFVDHFFRYTRLFPIIHKSDVYSVRRCKLSF